jgi:thiamine kinase-like enzyme
MHAARERLYRIAEALPRVLCHLDFWTKNVIMRDDGRLALLDWAFVGDGAVGEDIGNLIPDAAFDHFVPAESIPDLEAAVLEAYTEGLADAGWRGDPRVVELGMAASAIKYDWLTPAMLASASAAKQLRYGGTEEIDADYRYRERGRALLDNTRRARRAVALANELHR